MVVKQHYIQVSKLYGTPERMLYFRLQVTAQNPTAPSQWDEKLKSRK